MSHRLNKLRQGWLDSTCFKAKYQKEQVEEYPNNVLKAVPNPEISVRITTYQHRANIRKAIESVLMQEIGVPWEIIIGDDESTDGTREICIEYAQKYPGLIRLFLHKRENNIAVLGKPCGIFQIVYNTFNLRGKYIAPLSGDDYWDSKYKLLNQFHFLIKNNNYSMVCIPVLYRKQQYDKIFKLEKASKKYPFPCSLMCINKFDKLPKEMLSSINEDEFFKAIYLQYGRSKIISNGGNAVMNHTGNNLWANNSSGKKGHIINTSELLYNVFGNIDYRFKRNLASKIYQYGLKSKYRHLLNSDIWLKLYVYYYKVRSFFVF